MLISKMNNFKEYGFIGTFDGEILAYNPHGGYIGYVIHRGCKRYVVFTDDGNCYDIYQKSKQLICWDRYNLKKIRTNAMVIYDKVKELISKLKPESFLMKLSVGCYSCYSVDKFIAELLELYDSKIQKLNTELADANNKNSNNNTCYQKLDKENTLLTNRLAAANTELKTINKSIIDIKATATRSTSATVAKATSELTKKLLQKDSDIEALKKELAEYKLVNKNTNKTQESTSNTVDESITLVPMKPKLNTVITEVTVPSVIYIEGTTKTLKNDIVRTMRKLSVRYTNAAIARHYNVRSTIIDRLVKYDTYVEVK